MTAGRLIITGILALLMAFGASSSGSARAGYSNGSGWDAYRVYPAYSGQFPSARAIPATYSQPDFYVVVHPT